MAKKLDADLDKLLRQLRDRFGRLQAERDKFKRWYEDATARAKCYQAKCERREDDD